MTGTPTTDPKAAAEAAAVQTRPTQRGRATVSVFAPEDDGLRGLVPIDVIYQDGEFEAIYVQGDLDDGDDGASLEAWIAANGDECWATLADHRGGPTLSLSVLAAKAAALSAEVG